jgi:Domain of unknown function (DUF4376)
MKFTVYETLSGRVLYGGNGEFPATKNSESILKNFEYFSGWVVNNTHFEAAHSPSVFHTFNWTNKEWEDLRPHTIILEAQWQQIKSIRTYKQAQGAKVAQKWFHSDEPSRIQQLGLVMMGANIPTGLQWKTMDGSFVTMTQTLAMQIFAAAATQDQAIFAAAEQHRANMIAATDPEAYDFTQNWPPVYVP